MVGIGVDIVEIKRIEEAVSKQSKFLSKLFTTSERAYFVSKNNRAETIAGFFAAKEESPLPLPTSKNDLSESDLIPNILDKDDWEMEIRSSLSFVKKLFQFFPNSNL